MNNLRSTFSSLREYLTPISHVSTFKETGEITPEEFILAGDYLVFKFPTWQWSPCSNASLEKNFLPKDKQFLVTRKVPSLQRAMSYLDAGGDFEDEEEDHNDEGDEGWAISKRHSAAKSKPVITTNNNKLVEPQENTEFDLNDQDIQDIDDDDFEPVGNLSPADMSNKRTYDLFISYSTSYKVPKMYLVGYDSNGIPLAPQQMFEDIASDYRDKTATIEKAPFLENTTSVSIHPCRHATVMKVLMNRAQMASFRKSSNSLMKGVTHLGLKDSEEMGASNKSNDDVEEEWESVNDEDTEDVVRVDQYLVIFLKFIASVTPGITHDYTMNAF